MAKAKYKTPGANAYQLTTSQRIGLIGQSQKKIPMSKLHLIEQQRQRFMRHNNGKDGLN